MQKGGAVTEDKRLPHMWQKPGNVIRTRHCVAQYFVTSAGFYGSLPATSVIPTGVEAGRPSSSKSNLLSE